VEDLLGTLAGKRTLSSEVESMWNQIVENKIPARWLLYSYSTAHTSLAAYLVDLSAKLEFWQNLASPETNFDLVPSFWLPAFFFPEALLDSQARKLARAEQAPFLDLSQAFEVQTFFEADGPCEEKNSIFVHGLWLEGAAWDL
jgi:dynein heavy chain